MKILILLTFISVSCFAQQPAAMDPILVQDLDFTLVRPEIGKPYKVLLRKNHALLAENIPDSTWVTICYQCGIQPGPDPIVKETIDSEALTYENWTRHGATSAAGWSEGTISYSTTGEASYTFTGTGVEVWGETGNHGTGTVSIGNQSKTVSWQSDVRKLPAKIVEFAGLTRGQHTVTIRPVSGTITIDYLVITK